MKSQNNGRLVVVSGSSRSGKSEYVRRLLRHSPRVLIYDPKCHPDEWPGFYVVASLSSMARAMKKTADGPGRYRLCDRRLVFFDLFCRSALAWLRLAPCVIVADELAAVTSPGKAPAGWGQVCRTARGFGADIYAITQRPAESDKTCFGNASEFVTFSLSRDQDRAYMAREMDLDKSVIAGLAPYACARRTVGGGAVVRDRDGRETSLV